MNCTEIKSGMVCFKTIVNTETADHAIPTTSFA